MKQEMAQWLFSSTSMRKKKIFRAMLQDTHITYLKKSRKASLVK